MCVGIRLHERENHCSIRNHSYADDIQLPCRLTNPNNDIHLLNNYITDIHTWINNNSLTLTF